MRGSTRQRKVWLISDEQELSLHSSMPLYEEKVEVTWVITEESMQNILMNTLVTANSKDF